jgi:hypothetical protein
MARRGHEASRPQRGLDPTSARLLTRFADQHVHPASTFDYIDVIGNIRMENLYIEQLRKAGLVEIMFWNDGGKGEPIKGYRITASGRAYLELLK